MFALRSASGDWALRLDGSRFTYSSRSTARIAARILGKRDKRQYTVVDA